MGRVKRSGDGGGIILDYAWNMRSTKLVGQATRVWYSHLPTSDVTQHRSKSADIYGEKCLLECATVPMRSRHEARAVRQIDAGGGLRV